jgi:hypothetical protein
LIELPSCDSRFTIYAGGKYTAVIKVTAKV